MNKMIIPAHVAFIMDGNGRWAKERGLPRYKGHLAGINHIKKVVDVCTRIGIQFVSAYVWSTENWGIPANKERNLMQSIVKYGPEMAKETAFQRGADTSLWNPGRIRCRCS